MVKRTRDSTVSKVKKERIARTKKPIDVEFIKTDFKSRIDGGFQALNSALRLIPVELVEITPILTDLQKYQGWIHYFIDSLAVKDPVDKATPQ